MTQTPQYNDPGAKGREVTPNDSADLANPGYLRVGTGGSLRIDIERNAAADNPVNLANVADGEIIPWRVSRVHAAGTTASDIVVGWS